MNIKTLRELCNTYQNSDSVNERKELTESIEKIVRNYLNGLYKIQSRYNNINNSINNSIFHGSEFRHDSGSLTLSYIGNNGVGLIYEDYWSYGGHCRESFSITFDEVDNFDEIEIIKENIEKARKRLNYEISIAESNLKKAIENLEKFNVNNIS